MCINNISLRNVNENDVPMLRHLAESCPPLDVHTHYTYWVLCKFFSHCCFILTKNKESIGFITAIDTDDCVFIWQIGILGKYRSKKYSYMLIDAVREHAKNTKKIIQVSISEDNERSYCAFRSFCKANGYSFTESGELCLYDFADKTFCEAERIYDIDIMGTV